MKRLFSDINFLKSTIEVLLQLAITSIFSHSGYLFDLISQLNF
jgi:hypothetical protein